MTHFYTHIVCESNCKRRGCYYYLINVWWLFSVRYLSLANHYEPTLHIFFFFHLTESSRYTIPVPGLIPDFSLKLNTGIQMTDYVKVNGLENDINHGHVIWIGKYHDEHFVGLRMVSTCYCLYWYDVHECIKYIHSLQVTRPMHMPSFVPLLQSIGNIPSSNTILKVNCLKHSLQAIHVKIHYVTLASQYDNGPRGISVA